MLMAKTKQSKSSKTTAPNKTSSLPEESSTPIDNVVVDVPSENPGHDAVLDEFSMFMANLQQVSSHLNTLRAGFKQLEKKVTKELKQAQKLSKKNRPRPTESLVGLSSLLVLVKSLLHS